MSGMYWVMLLGLIGATPLFGLAVGAAFGALEGAFRDYGIDDDWDPRSLLLNFEFNVECYEETLAQALNSVIDVKQKLVRQATLQEVDARRLAERLRDGMARLLSPC
jgi:uncharacterized membrane protein